MTHAQASKPTPQEIASNLSGFIGTQGYHALSMFSSVVFTDGCHYVAENCGAFWLMDKIAARLIESFKSADFVSIHFFVDKKEGKIHYRWAPDPMSEKEDAIEEKVDYTDFPLPSLKLYAQRGGPETWVVMLTSEY